MNKKLIMDIFRAGVEAAFPFAAVKNRAEEVRRRYADGNFNRLVAAGFGKGAFPMALAAENALGDLLTEGLIITKYGHSDPLRPLKRMRVIEAAHPIPDENGVLGAEKIIRLLQGADEKTLILCLISGGGSALLTAPSEGITLAEKQMLTGLLLNSGATIHEINAVRKHISRVKGGRLAELAFPAAVVSLIISDVIGDNLDVISSGPTAPDTSTYTNALAVLDKYGLTDAAPASVLTHLRSGANGAITETPKPGTRCFTRVENIIAENNISALRAAAEHAKGFGFTTKIVSSNIHGDVREAAGMLAAMAKDATHAPHLPLCLVSGGETTVNVTGNGKGGRNMELALAFAIAIEGMRGISFLSAGTDGTDGPTDAAGAIVDGGTIPHARHMGLDPEAFLANNDSYTFFAKTGGLVITGPTGTNVMDAQIMLIA